MNVNVIFCGLEFPNPTVLASGYLGVTGASLANCTRHDCAGVTSKTLFLEERKGHPNPTVLTFKGGMINAVGLSGEGIKNAGHEFEVYKEQAPNNPMICSIGGKSIDELVECARIAEDYPIDMLELNFSCPNVHDEMGRPFACDPKMTEDGMRAVRKVTKKPISVKLSPNVSNIGLIARHAEAAGADAITAVNTMGPGMLIDIHMRRPILANKVGAWAQWPSNPSR
ncbi:tRNA-dihydrouridine synthase [Candidatus Peregrinibacteria bacterium]|nr:MAG: tRNA-dihydrouridine synthase [Candidatus Peregrinibacteria bacterium]